MADLKNLAPGSTPHSGDQTNTMGLHCRPRIGQAIVDFLHLDLRKHDKVDALAKLALDKATVEYDIGS